jgi:hypothetical protein
LRELHRGRDRGNGRPAFHLGDKALGEPRRPGKLFERNPALLAQRPTKYSEDVVERFLDYIIEGMTVAAALKQDDMPVKQTILNWTRAHPEFRREYDEAISFRNQLWMDDCIDIADGPQPEGVGSRETRIAARWKLLSGMASHARRKRSDDAKAMAQDRQHLIENDPVYGKLYEWEIEARQNGHADDEE